MQKIYTTSESSNVAIRFGLDNLSSQYPWTLSDVFFNLTTNVGATAANTLTITKNSNAGEEYNVNLFSLPMFGVQDFHWQPDRKLEFNGKDSLDIAWTNDASSFKTWGLEIKYEV